MDAGYSYLQQIPASSNTHVIVVQQPAPIKADDAISRRILEFYIEKSKARFALPAAKANEQVAAKQQSKPASLIAKAPVLKQAHTQMEQGGTRLATKHVWHHQNAEAKLALTRRTL